MVENGTPSQGQQVLPHTRLSNTPKRRCSVRKQGGKEAEKPEAGEADWEAKGSTKNERRGVYSGEGSTDNCLRPSRRHSSPVVNTGQNYSRFSRLWRAVGGDAPGQAGDRSRQGPRARQARQGPRGGEGCRPHTHGGRSPSDSDYARRPSPTTLLGPFPTCAPRTALGASGNVTSGTRPAPPPAAGLGHTFCRT